METNYETLLEDLIKELINNGYLTDQAITCTLLNDPMLLINEPRILSNSITSVGVFNEIQQKIQEIVDRFNVEETEEKIEEEPIEEPIEELMEEPAEEPIEEPIEELVEEPAEEPIEELVEELTEEPTEEPEPTYVTISYELGEFPDKFRDNVAKKLPISKQVEVGYTLTAEDLPPINLTKTQANNIDNQTVGYNKNVGDIIDSDTMISFGIII